MLSKQPNVFYHRENLINHSTLISLISHSTNISGNSEISIFLYELALNNENDEKFKLL